MRNPRPPPPDRFMGGLVMAIGGLMFALCGLCTVGLTVMTFIESLHSGGGSIEGAVMLYLIVGGVPAFVGFLLLRLGWRMYRGPRLPPDIGKAFDE